MRTKIISTLSSFDLYTKMIIVIGSIVLILAGCLAGPDLSQDGSEVIKATDSFQENELDSEQPLQAEGIEVSLASTLRTSTLINDEGGVIDVQTDRADFTLAMPVLALTDEKEISLTPVKGIHGFPFSEEMLAAVQLEPAGSQFLEPVILSIQLSNPSPPNLVGFIMTASGERFHLYPTEVSGNVVTFRLAHFTVVGLGSASPEEIQTIDTTQLSDRELIEHEMAALNEAINPDKDNPEEIPDLWFDEMARLLFEQFIANDGIWSKLASAQSIGELKSALSKILVWSRMVEELGIGERLLPYQVSCGKGSICLTFDELDTEARNLFYSVIEELIKEANRGCLAGSSARDDDILRYLKFACDVSDLSDTILSLEQYSQLRDLKYCGLESLKMTVPQNICFAAGETAQVEVEALDYFGDVLPDRQMVWESSDRSVVQIDQLGMVTGKEGGTAWIEVFDKIGGSKCSFHTEEQINVVSLNGSWTAKETADESDCGDGVNTYTSFVNISHTGPTVSIVGPNGSGAGSKVGCMVTDFGREIEDEGVSWGGGSFTISQDGNSMTGGGGWTWEGVDPETGKLETCSGSSSMTITR